MLTLTLIAVLSATPDAGTVPSNPVTKATMQGVYGALIGLEPYLTKRPNELTKQERDEFLSRLDALAGLKHAFPVDPKAQEPATAALSTLFARYALDTRRSVERGDKNATLRVRTLVSLCFTCHSRERVVQDFADAAKTVDALRLEPMERAQYLAATRQFDEALKAYRALLEAPVKDERVVFDHTHALRDAMAIAVRVKDDAKLAQQLVDAEAAHQGLPDSVRATVAAWKKDVTAWQKERFDAARASPNALFDKAKSLLDRAQVATSYFPDEKQDIKLLRASGYLNLALGKDPKLKARGEALELLGECASGLKSPLLWDVDLLYFETCVWENPHTGLARRCFDRFEDRVTFGFTGSSGTHLPQDELDRLAALRALAAPAK